MEPRNPDPTEDSSEDAQGSTTRISEKWLISSIASTLVNKHESNCPAGKAYQRMLGVMAVGMVLIGFIVWLGQNAMEYKIEQAVERAMQRRMPFAAHVPATTAPSGFIRSATAATAPYTPQP